MSSPHREAVLEAVAALAAHPDPQSLSDGLSPAMAARCLSVATGLITRESLDAATAVPGLPPTTAAVVVARGVFTAGLEWVAMLAAVGARVTLKVPAAAPTFGEAVAAAFASHGLPVSFTTAHLLPDVEALVAMGSDETMSELASRHAGARLSLHGHRFSLAAVQGPEEAAGLALDATLYDGRGCFTPAAVFVLGSGTEEVAEVLHRELGQLHGELPPGPTEPSLGPHMRRRLAQARVLGAPCLEGPGWATAVLPLELMEPVALPRFLPVHPVRDMDELRLALAPLKRHLATCATDLRPPGPLVDLGFERICRPGAMQAPPMGRPHGGREGLRDLMFHVSREL